jgi:hypothetical protein
VPLLESVRMNDEIMKGKVEEEEDQISDYGEEVQ